MEIQKCSGIVLSSTASGEADRIARIFTREYGKRNFIFKGLRKSRKRPPSAAEPGSILHLIYYYHPDREIYVVNDFKLLGQFPEIRKDLSKVLHLYLAVECVDRTSGYQDASPAVYDLLAAGLEALSRPGSAEHFSAFFIMHLLRIHGLVPDFSRCRICGKDDWRLFVLDQSDLHPVCADCLKNRDSRIGGVLLTEASREFLTTGLTGKFSHLDLAHYPIEEIRNLLFSLCLFLEGYFHVRLKSKNLIFSELPGA